MLLWLFDRLASTWPEAAAHFAAWEKITLRAGLAAILAFALAVALGPRLIDWLRVRFREPIKGDSAELCRLHQGKQATPTMGGLFLMAGLAGAALLLGDLGNRFLLLALFVAGTLTAIGAIDDLVKLRRSANGISARSKLLGQTVVAAVAAVCLYQYHANVPGGLSPPPPLHATGVSLGLWFIPLAVIVIVGSSNAVNLADGLDGLAGGCLVFAAGAMTLVVYAGGHAGWAAYLNVPRVPGVGELAVPAAGMIGAVVGFLWFNCHPAQVFMGDTGALPLGGLLGLLAVAARQELLLLIVAGVFVAEAGSVLLQVGYYKWRRRRIFRCAPLHHHFQFQGWPENKIVVRFWIAAALCALVGLAGLKMGAGTERKRTAQSAETMENDMKKSTHIVFTGGGTAGHLFPALAVARQLTARIDGVRITMAGSGKDFERRHAAAAGFHYLALPCRPLPRGAREAVSFVLENVAGYLAAARFLANEQVDAVVGLGGYASVPMGRAARRQRVPLVLLEQNVIPGCANRWLARSARLVCTSFQQTAALLPCRCTVRCTGNPIVCAASLPRANVMPGKANARPMLLVLGGSGGARSLNENVPRTLYKMGGLLQDWRIVHQTGEADLEATRALYRKLALEAAVEAFLPNLPERLAETGAAICRAGGTTLAELAAAGVPAVLLPYPHAKDDHQRCNAEVFACAGGAMLVDEREVTGRLDDRLAETLSGIVGSPALRESMSAAMRSLARPHAAADVAALVWSLVSSRVRALAA